MRLCDPKNRRRRQARRALRLGAVEVRQLGMLAADPIKELGQHVLGDVGHGQERIAIARLVGARRVGRVVDDMKHLEGRADRLGVVPSPHQCRFGLRREVHRNENRRLHRCRALDGGPFQGFTFLNLDVRAFHLSKTPFLTPRRLKSLPKSLNLRRSRRIYSRLVKLL